MLQLFGCCGCCEGTTIPPVDSDVLEKAIGLSKTMAGRSGNLKVSGLRISGDGQILAEQSVLQDRAFWEATIEHVGGGLTIGVVGPSHDIGSVLGQPNGADWVLKTSHLPAPGLATGSVIGVALDQSDYPVRLRFFHNGNLCEDIRGPVTEAVPIFELTDGAVVNINFGEQPFASKPAGFDGVIRSQSLI